jgi:hypothetical protein
VLLLPATRRDGEAIAAFLGKHRIVCEVCPNAALAAKAMTEEAKVEAVLRAARSTRPQ